MLPFLFAGRMKANDIAWCQQMRKTPNTGDDGGEEGLGRSNFHVFAILKRPMWGRDALSLKCKFLRVYPKCIIYPAEEACDCRAPWSSREHSGRAEPSAQSQVHRAAVLTQYGH